MCTVDLRILTEFSGKYGLDLEERLRDAEFQEASMEPLVAAGLALLPLAMSEKVNSGKSLSKSWQ